MRENKLRRLLNAGKPSLSTHLHSSWPSVVEAVGHTGVFDYVEFVAEYAPYDLYALDNFCRAVELFDMGAMIKVDQANQHFVAQRAIGSGFQSVLFTDVHSVAEAQACLDAVRPDAPPLHGTYGVGTRRHTYMNYGGSARYVESLRETVVALMIEKQGAVDHLEEILALGGIDMVQWGPADYCMNIGRPGDWRAPEIMAIERQVIETSLRMGVQPRAEIGRVDDARYYLDLGVRHFSLGTDIHILFQWFKENGDELRRVVEHP